MQSSNPVLNRSSAFAPGHGQAYPGAAPYGQPGPYGQPAQQGGGYAGPQQYQGAPASSRPMTLDDVIVKTALTLGVVVIFAALAWWKVPDDLVGPAFLAGMLVAFGLGMVLSFMRKVSPALVMLYAAAEGVFLGIGCEFIGRWVGDPSIVAQAVLATLVTAGLTLASYKFFNIKVTARFARMVIIATLGFVGVLLINFIAEPVRRRLRYRRLGRDGPAVRGDRRGPRGVQPDPRLRPGRARGGGRRAAERGLAGRVRLTVTLVWLYWNLLRILAILRGGE